MLPAGTVNTRTRLVLANAVYFEVDWRSLFHVADTGPNTFFVGGKSAVTRASATRAEMQGAGFWKKALSGKRPSSARSRSKT